MSGLAPLVDEVILADNRPQGFLIEEIVQEIRDLFEERGESSVVCLSFHEWSQLIRGRCSVLHFELVRQGEEVRWVKKEEGR